MKGEVMRSEFEKHIREHSGFTSNFEVGCNGQYKSDLMHFMFITWQHRQTEVDELQKRVDATERKLQLVQECIKENAYSNMRSGGLVIQVAVLGQAIKGESK